MREAHMGRQTPHADHSEGDEQLLVARSQRGDVPAFNQLVERYQDSAYGLALRMLGDPELAADVTQDAFMSAFRAVERFRGGSFRAWLLRIVSNACYDQWRAARRHPTTSLELVAGDDHGEAAHPEPHDSFIDDRWNPEAAALRGELIELIARALLQLPPEQRLAVVLSDVQGLAYDEIAEVMQTSLGTVKSRIARGRSHLRDLLRTHPELLPSTYRRASEMG
jgi:RNA polymerase sigma-70 factor (ECF subfamily)